MNPEVSALHCRLGHTLNYVSVLPSFLKPQLPEEAGTATHAIMSERTALDWPLAQDS